MGASNFASPKNASKYFVIGMNRGEKYSSCGCGNYWEWEEEYMEESVETCPECQEDIKHGTETRPLETWEWDDLKQNIMDSLDELEGFTSGESHDYARNYGSTFLGELEKSKSWGDAEFHVVLKPCVTSGYYEGATLDFAIEITTYGETFDYNEDDIETILDDGFDEYYIELNRGLATRFRPYAKAWIEDTIQELSEQLEKVFQNWSEHKLQRLGGMSDGTSVYQEVE